MSAAKKRNLFEIHPRPWTVKVDGDSVIIIDAVSNPVMSVSEGTCHLDTISDPELAKEIVRHVNAGATLSERSEHLVDKINNGEEKPLMERSPEEVTKGLQEQMRNRLGSV